MDSGPAQDMRTPDNSGDVTDRGTGTFSISDQLRGAVGVSGHQGLTEKECPPCVYAILQT